MHIATSVMALLYNVVKFFNRASALLGLYVISMPISAAFSRSK